MTRSSDLRAAVMALVAALVLSSCALVGGGDTYEVVAYFPRAVSLYEKGAVQVLGLPAGEVTDVRVEGNRVRVAMAIDADIPLPSDVQAALAPQSLIGERRIQLFPPYQEGQAVAVDGHVIEIEQTIVPVEPDEALAALKEFLDSLDPNGIGRLIDNAATTLDGQGENLGSALGELSELVGNIEANDDDIIRIAERFDDFTATLLTRESQLADVIDDFAIVADVLADERKNIEALVSSLAGISENGLDLIAEHAVRLRTDVAILSRLTASINTNLDAVTQITLGGRDVIGGFLDAYNPALRAFDLRNNFGPAASEALSPIFDSVGVPVPCVPIDGTCPEGGVAPLSSADDSTRLDRPSTPIDSVLGLLGSPTRHPLETATTTPDRRSMLSRFLGTFFGVGA